MCSWNLPPYTLLTMFYATIRHYRARTHYLIQKGWILATSQLKQPWRILFCWHQSRILCGRHPWKRLRGSCMSPRLVIRAGWRSFMRVWTESSTKERTKEGLVVEAYRMLRSHLDRQPYLVPLPSTHTGEDIQQIFAVRGKDVKDCINPFFIFEKWIVNMHI